MKTFLALDLGGTKLLIGELDQSGKILRHKRYVANYANQREAVELIKRSLDDYIATEGWVDQDLPVAMGVGLVGRVDPCQGIWLQIDPRRTDPIPLSKELSEIYGMPVFIDNDVKSATQAIRRFELKSDNFVYINVGTGIAAGIIAGGKLIRGSHFNASEVGHNAVGVDLGITCACGRKDCVEMIAAGIGIDYCARMLAPEFQTKLNIPEGARVDVEEVFTLSREGDPLCVELVKNASQALAGLIMNLVRVVDPDTVVLGGGVIADGYLHGQALVKLNPTTIRFVTGGVVLTGLHPDLIGLIGAGAVAMNNYDKIDEAQYNHCSLGE